MISHAGVIREEMTPACLRPTCTPRPSLPLGPGVAFSLHTCANKPFEQAQVSLFQGCTGGFFVVFFFGEEQDLPAGRKQGFPPLPMGALGAVKGLGLPGSGGPRAGGSWRPFVLQAEGIPLPCS